MARRVNFGGASINVPGAYSLTSVNLVGAAPILPTGRVAILGEAKRGAPGEVALFTSQEMQSLIDYYGSGEIVNAARALINPSNDSRIRQGASQLFVVKTNASTRASLSLATGWGSFSDQNYGSDGNLIYSILDLSAEAWSVISSGVIADPTFNAGADLDSTTLTARVDGGALATFTFSAVAANHDTLAEVVADLNGSVTGSWAPSNPGLVFSAIDATHIGVTIAAGSNEHRKGRGRSFAIVDGTARTLLGLNAAAFNDVLKIADSEPSMRIRLARQLDNMSEDSSDNTGNRGGKIYMEIGCADTTCTLSISSTALSTSAATAADLSLALADYPTLNDLATYINSLTSYKCRIPSSINGGLSSSVLDRVSAIGIAYSGADKYPGRVKADAYEMASWVSSYSTLCSAARLSYCGLPDALAQSYLSGGLLGASSSSSFTAALALLEAEDVDLIIPLISQSASDDIAESSLITDGTSSYDCASILLATKNHCKQMSSVINRKERQAYFGFRGTFAECQAEALALNSEFVSLMFQDVQVVATSGNLEWQRPHIAACFAAGLHAGGAVGQPTTRKYLNINGIRHVKKQGLTPSLLEKFDARTQASLAIDKGLMVLVNPSSGGIRIVRQLSTYTKDDNFALIAPSVLSAANYVAKTLREGLESVFVGEKAKTGTAASIESYAIAIMSDMLRQDIIVGDDTNDKLGWKKMTVQIVGNAAYLDVTVTPVQAVDFVLNRITLDNIRSVA